MPTTFWGWTTSGPYNMRQKREIPVYGAAETLTTLRRQFAYIFDETPTDNLLPAVGSARD